VNGREIRLDPGDTIMVNSNQIHFSIYPEDVRYVICVVHPSVLMSSVAVEMQYVRPIIENPDLPYLKFRGLNEYARDVFQLMLKMPDIRHDAFQITMHFFRLWEYIRKQASHYLPDAEEGTADPRMQLFKSMMNYISSSYTGNVSLAEIAASANISKSLCNSLFNQYVGESPISYLMHLRCRKVAEYLRSSSKSLTEIAAMTGFNGVSYMSETFRKFFDCSPREYRKQWAGQN
jgi:AraC-like DNA-binding protein